MAPAGFASGQLWVFTETHWDGGALREWRLGREQAGFPLGWVHDGGWAPDPPARPDELTSKPEGE